MCRRFEDGLNEDIQLLVGILELKEFVVIVERACKAKELTKEKKKADLKARDTRNDGTCYRCGSQDHFIKDCPEMGERFQNARQSGSASKVRPPKSIGTGAGSKNMTREMAVRYEDRAPAKAYAIRARKEASPPDVITGAFSLYDTIVIALIDPGSTHSYVCMKLASSMNLPMELQNL
ncbi:uncharacterized protein [Gossypium hirsutum]|uniref:CCHC-type domain-containing protein n=1 Tax=Gossypium hirsutum TaxID=3635 RepID=A0A1U8MW71_GOSHI|nr:uncharacterized protein LOC107941947 [Gossypium hirsutum]